jgi:hypothetical protein
LPTRPTETRQSQKQCIEGDEFTIVSGLLSNHGSLPELEMRKWKRVKAADAKAAD